MPVLEEAVLVRLVEGVPMLRGLHVKLLFKQTITSQLRIDYFEICRIYIFRLTIVKGTVKACLPAKATKHISTATAY